MTLSDRIERVQIEHSAWADKTFGERSFAVDLEKLKAEASEAQESGTYEEFADIFLCLLSACKTRGINLTLLVQSAEEKLLVNRSRTWKQNADQTWSHVEKEVAA